MRGKFQAGMRAPGTTGENFIEVTGKLRWTIRINSGCPHDLAQLEGRFVQFMEGSSRGP